MYRRLPAQVLFAAIALMLAGSALAETPPDAAADAPVVDLQPVLPPLEPIPADQLGVATPIEDPSGRALHHFYESLRETEAGDKITRIVAYGASHTAGDSFTKVIRHRLQARFGDAGPGFIGLARPWRDYMHRDLNLTYSSGGWDGFWVSRSHSRDDGLYGLAGASFASGTKGAFTRVETAKKSEFGKSVSDIEIYYWKQKGGGDFTVLIDGKFAKRVKTRSKEPGPGYVRFDLEDGSHTVEIRPRGNGEVLLFGVAMEREPPGVVMDVLGINGARAATQLEWDPRLFAEHLTRRKPDLIILAYGTNATGDDTDPIAEYEARLDLVLNRIRSLLPETSCVYVGPSDRPVKVEQTDDEGETYLAFHPRPRQQQVINVQRKVAHRYGCGYWDWNAAMGGDLSMVSWTHSEPRLGARDYVHHTRAGYERLAGIFWDALMGAYAPAVVGQ